MTEPIIKTLTLACTPTHAFEVFVHRMNQWWPLDSHSVTVEHSDAATGGPAPSVAVEGHLGGSILETRTDGSTAVWGKILAYDPPRHFAMTWHPGTDPDRPTRVDVTFDALAPGGTLVTLTHSGWQVWAADAPAKRQTYDGGWEFVFCQRYRAAV
jgi:uncharacterized protein YndB with AHSA1/START domain